MTLTNTHSYGIDCYILVKNYQDTGLDIYQLSDRSELIEFYQVFSLINMYVIAYQKASYTLDHVVVNKDQIILYFKKN